MPTRFSGKAGIGPRGFLGITPRTFKERTLQNFTPLRVTQIGLEPWSSYDATFKVTQVGLEPWVANTPDLKVTQIGLEVWVSTLAATIYKSKLGPRGFQGITPRTFKERTLQVFIYPSTGRRRRVARVQLFS